jgi:hypothetical protein
MAHFQFLNADKDENRRGKKRTVTLNSAAREDNPN